MIIGIIVLVTGFEIIISSVKGIFYPNAVDYNLLIVFVLFITVVVKTFLSIYIEKQGKKLNSGCLLYTSRCV